MMIVLFDISVKFVGGYFVYLLENAVAQESADNFVKWPPVPDVNQSRYRYAGVATSQPECAEIGT